MDGFDKALAAIHTAFIPCLGESGAGVGGEWRDVEAGEYVLPGDCWVDLATGEVGAPSMLFTKNFHCSLKPENSRQKLSRRKDWEEGWVTVPVGYLLDGKEYWTRMFHSTLGESGAWGEWKKIVKLSPPNRINGTVKAVQFRIPAADFKTENWPTKE